MDAKYCWKGGNWIAKNIDRYRYNELLSIMFEYIDLGIKYVGEKGKVPVVLRIPKLGLGVWAGPLEEDIDILRLYESHIAKLSESNTNATILFCDYNLHDTKKTYLYKHGTNFHSDHSEYNERFNKKMIEFEDHADPFGTFDVIPNKLGLEFPSNTEWIIVNAWDDGSFIGNRCAWDNSQDGWTVAGELTYTGKTSNQKFYQSDIHNNTYNGVQQKLGFQTENASYLHNAIFHPDLEDKVYTRKGPVVPAATTVASVAKAASKAAPKAASASEGAVLSAFPELFNDVLKRLITINAHGGKTDEEITVPDWVYVMIPHHMGTSQAYTTPDATKDKLYEEVLYDDRYFNYSHGWKLYKPGETIHNMIFTVLSTDCNTINQYHNLQKPLTRHCMVPGGFKNYCPLYCTKKNELGTDYEIIKYNQKNKIKIKACGQYYLKDIFNNLTDDLTSLPKNIKDQIEPHPDTISAQNPILLIPFTCNDGYNAESIKFADTRLTGYEDNLCQYSGNIDNIDNTILHKYFMELYLDKYKFPGKCKKPIFDGYGMIRFYKEPVTYFLTNFYHKPNMLTIDGVSYMTSESAYHAQKYKHLLNYQYHAKNISYIENNLFKQNKKPGWAGYEYSRGNKSFTYPHNVDPLEWEVTPFIYKDRKYKDGNFWHPGVWWRRSGDSITVMEWIVYEKFKNNKDILDKLLSTGKSILVENAKWNDNYWGNGPKSKTHKSGCDNSAMERWDHTNNNHYFEDAWRGCNKLGVILMKIRGLFDPNLKLEWIQKPITGAPAAYNPPKQSVAHVSINSQGGGGPKDQSKEPIEYTFF